MELTKLEREIYEKYLLRVLKEGRLKWNQPQVPTILKQMAKDIVEKVIHRHPIDKQ